MQYDIVQCNTTDKLKVRIIKTFIDLPTNPWSIHKLSVEDSIAVFVGFITDNHPIHIKAIPRLENGVSDIFEIVKHSGTIGHVEITDDEEVIRHVVRMHKLVMEISLDEAFPFYEISQMIECLDDDATFNKSIQFADEVSEICDQAKADIATKWGEFLADFMHFQEQVPFAIAA